MPLAINRGSLVWARLAVSTRQDLKPPGGRHQYSRPGCSLCALPGGTSLHGLLIRVDLVVVVDRLTESRPLMWRQVH